MIQDLKRFVIGVVVFFFAMPTAFPQQGIDQKKLEELLAEAYTVDQDYDRALAEYRRMLERNPDDVQARASLAEVLSWQKEYDEAIAEYSKALARDPQNLELKTKLAEVYFWNQDFSAAAELYEEIAGLKPDDPKRQTALAEVYLRLGRNREAGVILDAVLACDPASREARILSAELYAAQKQLDKSLAVYREILAEKYDRQIKARIADVLSWRQDYRDALAIYDELLADEDAEPFRLQKARILGWGNRYRQALREYQHILDRGANEAVGMEMRAKQLYWDGRVRRAIDAYRSLLAADPANAEALFDLSQIYCYQAMWPDAISGYRDLLDLFPGHFRAREGLAKAEWFLSHPLLTAGYEFFKARSSTRDTDIRKNVLRSALDVPLSPRTMLGLDYQFIRRAFSDFRDLSENHVRVDLTYRKGPDWSVGGFFNLVTYHRGIDPVYEFGGQVAVRTWDVGRLILSQERSRLENNSEVIRRRFVRDDFKARQEVDVSKRIKMAADYALTYVSDHNVSHEPAGEVLYYLMLEPRAFYVKYRYAFRDFRREKTEYFSPRDFSLHAISFRWRHYFNPEGVFFGANDLYYEAGYDLSFDSQDVTSHQIRGGLVWDMTHRFQLRGEGQYTVTTSGIYEDTGARTSVKFFF
jgi:tetratricopeptide (TPR) repeat protein